MSKSDYEIVIEPSRGAPYEVDLREFAVGGNETTVRKVTTWGGDYVGRSDLALELADFLDTLSFGHSIEWGCIYPIGVSWPQSPRARL